jgi:hypothetical protein
MANSSSKSESCGAAMASPDDRFIVLESVQRLRFTLRLNPVQPFCVVKVKAC